MYKYLLYLIESVLKFPKRGYLLFTCTLPYMLHLMGMHACILVDVQTVMPITLRIRERAARAPTSPTELLKACLCHVRHIVIGTFVMLSLAALVFLKLIYILQTGLLLVIVGTMITAIHLAKEKPCCFQESRDDRCTKLLPFHVPRSV